MSHLRALAAAATDFLIPPKCLLCASTLEIGGARTICAPCDEALERFEPPWCPRCGAPFPSHAALSHSPAHHCAECAENVFHFDGARAVGAFKDSLRELVHLFKYGGVTKLAREFAPRLAALAADELGVGRDDPDVIVTHVPIASARWRERGFDQARLLALRTAKSLGAPHADCLERAKETRPQTGLSASERRRNVRGAFRARPKAARMLEGKTCILLDDVITTGFTASACARELKRAGAAAVHALTICRSRGLEPPRAEGVNERAAHNL